MTMALPNSMTLAGHLVTLLPAGPYEARYVAPSDSIGFAFDLQRGHHAVGSDRAEPFLRLPNSLALVPEDCDVRSQSSTGGEYLLVSGPRVQVQSGRYATNLQVPEALTAAQSVRRWFLGRDVPDSLDAENVITQLSDAASGPVRPAKAARWMTPRRLKKITDAIEDKLEQQITVAGLAVQIGVSASFLTRAFKASCGQSPYDFILSRRLQRARQLLTRTDLSLALIAARSGFSSQSHMTGLMTSRLGLTPAACRDLGRTQEPVSA